MKRSLLPIGLAGVILAAAAGIAITIVRQPPPRPPHWHAWSHQAQRPDARLVFPDEGVLDFTLTLRPEDDAAMRDDLRALLAASPHPPHGPPPSTGDAAAPPRPPPPGGESMFARDPRFVPVTLDTHGERWTWVGMRFKGNSSLQHLASANTRELPFRLDFSEYAHTHREVRGQRFYGWERMTFSPNFGDESRIREAFVIEAMRTMSVPVPRYAFVHLRVAVGARTEDWGLYTMLEDPADEAFLDTAFGSRAGNLYKPEGPGATFARFDRASFEKKNNTRHADYRDIEGAIAALHAPTEDRAAWRTALEARFDVDGFLTWLALNTALANWDAYGRMAHNYYLYGDPARHGQLRWISWDHNLALGAHPPGPPPGHGPPPGGPPPPFGSPPRQGGPPGPGGPAEAPHDELFHTHVDRAAWPLFLLLDDPVYRARYVTALRTALAAPLSAAFVDALVPQLHARIAPAVTSPSEAFQRSVDDLRAVLAVRRERVREALAVESGR